MSDALSPPTCGQDHNGFQTCRGPDDGCYQLAGVYEEDARYIYPAREQWYRERAEEMQRGLRAIEQSAGGLANDLRDEGFDARHPFTEAASEIASAAAVSLEVSNG